MVTMKSVNDNHDVCVWSWAPYVCKSQNVSGDCDFLTKTECTYSYGNMYIKVLNKLNGIELWDFFLNKELNLS